VGELQTPGRHPRVDVLKHWVVGVLEELACSRETDYGQVTPISAHPAGPSSAISIRRRRSTVPGPGLFRNKFEFTVGKHE